VSGSKDADDGMADGAFDDCLEETHLLSWEMVEGGLGKEGGFFISSKGIDTLAFAC
jgi:hypothetical protein